MPRQCGTPAASGGTPPPRVLRARLPFVCIQGLSYDEGAQSSSSNTHTPTGAKMKGQERAWGGGG